MRMKAKNADNGGGALGLVRRLLRGARREEGGSLVEMALVSAFVYLPMMFGIFQVSYGLYVYNFVCSAAHQATRYAAVRGSNSCTIQSNFVDCDLSPAGSNNPAPGAGTPLQNYVQSLAFAGISPNNLTVTSSWYSQNFTAPSGTGFSTADWNTACTDTSSTNNCNNIGNAVQVSVVYQFPLHIPFWGGKTLPITGVSKMLISE